MSALLMRTDGGALILWMMLACGLVGIADVLINDTGLFRFRIEAARTHRHFGFSGLAFCYVCQIFIAALSVKSRVDGCVLALERPFGRRLFSY